jgi:glycosyltransferase involved in cell wall biosynthesis
LCTFACVNITQLEQAANIPVLNILQISSAQTLGGGERHLVDLVHGLVRRGHEVHVAARPNAALLSELGAAPPASITTLPLRNSLDVPGAQALAKFVRKNQIQVVHAHLARDYPLASFAVRRNREARLIVTRHVLFALNRLHRVTLARASCVIAVSQAVAAQLTADAVVPADRIRVVLNGIDLASWREARENFRRAEFLERWHLPANSLLVGTIGELTPLKGQEQFLRAAAQVLRSCPHAFFIVAGIDHSAGKKYQARLEELLDELQLRERVRLVGWVEDLAQLYCALDVFVSASHTESFGLVLAEAMASGTAVVATETPGACELITADETGLIIPIGNVESLTAATLRLLHDAGLRARLGLAAQQEAAGRFGVERMIDETEAVYRAALQNDEAD